MKKNEYRVSGYLKPFCVWVFIDADDFKPC